MNEQEFKQRYPVIHDFLETTFWLKFDGANLFEVLYAIAVHAHPERAVRYGAELKAMWDDRDVTNEELSDLFNRGSEPRYSVVGRDNAKSVLYCLGEFLDFMLSDRARRG